MTWPKILGLIFLVVMGAASLIGVGYDLAALRQEKKSPKPNPAIIDAKTLDIKACSVFFLACAVLAGWLIFS